MSRHHCEGRLPFGGYGSAVDECYEKEDGTLWVDNSEYASQVAFCPFCGFEAKIQPYIERE